MSINSASAHAIAAPPADRELGFARKPLTYWAALPGAGIGPETGIILFLCPWGMHPAQEYCRDVLLPRLADQYDCVAAAPAYFGIGVKFDPDALIQPHAGWTDVIRKNLGDAVAALPARQQFRALAEAGVSEVPRELAFSINCFPEYQSFGFMPALDTIAVLADLLRRFDLRRDRLHCFGSSYGGYIAALVLKLMPNTFHVIVENSGFVAARPQEMNNLEFNGFNWRTVEGLRFPIFHVSPWTFANPASPRFAGPAVMAIRNCLIPEHYAPSRTLMRSYHSAHDRLVPIDDKRRFWDSLDAKMALRRIEVGAAMVDGRLFKTVEHGMDASLLELMADAMRETPAAAGEALTDFERQTLRVLPAEDRAYVVRFAPDLSFEVEVAR